MEITLSTHTEDSDKQERHIIMKLEENVRLQKIEIKSLKAENENLKLEMEGDVNGNNHNK